MVVIVTTNLSSQLPGNYQPLEFDDLVPLWTHVTYDSTIVGHDILNPRSVGIEFDGYSHVFPSMDIEIEPLIYQGFYYKVSRTIYDTDVSGGLIEKIDLSNGEIIWKQVFDLRTQDRREFIGRTLIKDDKLILIDLDIITPDHPDVPVPIVAYAGFDTYGILKIREYDLQTGELVCIDVADENDPNVMLIRSAEEYSTRIYMIDDSTFQVIDYKNEYQLDIAPYLLVDTINRQGQYLNSTDTIFSSYQFDADWTDTRRNKSLNVIIDEYTDEIVWFDDYIEGNFNQGDSKGRILKIKNNELKKLEIPDVFSKGSPQGLGLGNYLVSGIQTEAPIGAPSHKGIFMTDFLVTPENIGVETVSVNNIVTNEGKFNVFPNPSKSMLNIQSFANKDYNAIIVNSFGQTVKELSIKEQSIISFDINNLISGNYYVYFISNSDVETLPLIIVN